jgi:ribosomal-protein-alanine N-acetyltransferase
MASAATLNDKFTIRPYRLGDKAAVINLMKLNTPKYFAQEEQSAFKHFLENEIDQYFVIEFKTEIFGCGGFNCSEDESIAYITWDMVHPHFHGLTLGTQLLRHRMQLLKLYGNVHSIIVRTSQLTFPFYEKRGFKCLEIQENYWAPGFDMVVMRWEGQ